jgi:hypothetical protein
MRRIAALAAAVLMAWSAAAPGAGVPGMRNPSGSVMRKYDTPYYQLYTDLGEADAREADLRMTRMFEEYQRRTAGFAGQVKGKFPFYLFKSKEDYLAAGAPQGSSGVFIQAGGANWLMAAAGQRTSAYTWHIVQHEGFHQFIAATIPNEIPVWANEGLAEYFGEGIWTGDGFVTGLVSQERLEEVQAALRERRVKPFAQMLAMSAQAWGSKLEYSNYTQAWAMVHFLAHGDGGKYQAPFVQFMLKVGRGAAPDAAWRDVFGKDTAAFEQRFSAYWLGLPQNPTRGTYLHALVQTQTSFLARAVLQRQTFTDAPGFLENYKPADLAVNRDLWLPPALFEESSAAARKIGSWSLEAARGGPMKLVCGDEDGTKYVGNYTVANGKVGRVWVEILPAGGTTRGVTTPGPGGSAGAGGRQRAVQGR